LTRSCSGEALDCGHPLSRLLIAIPAAERPHARSSGTAQADLKLLKQTAGKRMAEPASPISFVGPWPSESDFHVRGSIVLRFGRASWIARATTDGRYWSRRRDPPSRG
jgi:hypothetical protein